MNKFNLSFSEADMQVLQAALLEMPYRVAAPLINKINTQIQQAHDVAVDKREGDTQVSRHTTANLKAS